MKVKLVNIGLFLCVIKKFFEISNLVAFPDFVDDILTALILLVFFYSIIKKRYSFRTLLLYSILIIFTLFNARITGYMIIPMSVVMILSVRGESLKEVGAFIFKIKLVCIIINTIFAIFLSLFNVISIYGYYDDGSRLRFHFGYGYPGHFADYIFDLLVLWIFVNYDKLRKKDFICMLIISIACFLFTDSRVIFANSVVLILFTFIIKHTDKLNTVFRLLAQSIVPILTFLMLEFINLYRIGNAYAFLIDKILNTRIRLNGYKFDLYGYTLFGRTQLPSFGEWSSVWISTGGAFDNVYMWLIIQMGIIWLCIIALAFFILAKRNNKLINILLIIWALGAFIDTDFLNGICSFPILLTSLLLSGYRSHEYESLGIYKKNEK